MELLIGVKGKESCHLNRWFVVKFVEVKPSCVLVIVQAFVPSFLKKHIPCS